MMVQRLTFSTVSEQDLKTAGIQRKRLVLNVFKPEKISKLTEGMKPTVEAEIADLLSRIKKIYARVNMDVSLSLVFPLSAK